MAQIAADSGNPDEFRQAGRKASNGLHLRPSASPVASYFGSRVARILALSFVFIGTDGQSALWIPTAFAQPTPAAEVADDEPSDDKEAVIPPGKEELLGEMLGLGATFPGDCKFATGEADGPAIRVTYTCPTGEVVFQLVHPSRAALTATKTDRFAVTLQSGSPPDGLAAALVSRIRSREGAFEWMWVGKGRRSRSSGPTTLLAAAGLLGIVALGWLVRRRLAARRKHPR